MRRTLVRTFASEAEAAEASEDGGMSAKVFAAGVAATVVLGGAFHKLTAPKKPEPPMKWPDPKPVAVPAAPVETPSPAPSVVAAVAAAPTKAPSVRAAAAATAPVTAPPPAATPAAKAPAKVLVAAVALPSSPLPAGAKSLGTVAGWNVYESAGSVFAENSVFSSPPLQLTPPGVSVGAVLVGADELLVEYPAAFGSDASSLYRVKLPTSDDLFGVDDPVPDTLSPAGTCTQAGSVESWITACGSPLAVRGALVRSESSLSLALRSQEVARVGNPLWLATCKRLGLPEPPKDPNGPTLFSEWKLVATFDGAAGVSYVGFKDEATWLYEAATNTAVAFAPDGSRTEVSLA